MKISDTRHTARFVCTTDTELAQMATFYPGAMSEAREVELKPVADRLGGLDLVLVEDMVSRKHAKLVAEGGDLAITDYMCETLATDPTAVSPTKFHNSVHNAAAGYWTIAAGAMEPATAISADFAMGLLEALAQLATGADAVLLVGYGAGFLPWFADIDRQMYFFYAATMAPFLVMILAMILGDILYEPGQNAERRTLGLLVVCIYVAVVITNFAWLYPVLTGLPISQQTWDMQIWLPSWR